MIRVHLLPEMDLSGPAAPCAQIRLLRPYRQEWLRTRVDVTAGPQLPSGPLDVVVTQRGGPFGATLARNVELVREVRARGAKLVYDLDDDLLATHPVLGMELALRSQRPRIRFLLREADLVVVSTPILRDHVAALARRCAVLPNGLDEALIPPLRLDGRGADVGYFGTPTHLPDLMAVLAPLERSAAGLGRAMRFEICGVSDDPRLPRLSAGNLWVKCLPEVDAYDDVHAVLANDARWQVGLAPLQRGTFNDAKSDIKVLDYAAAGIAVVVADSPVYAAWGPGLVERVPHEAFDGAIGRLLEDGEYRNALARRAHDHLLQTRTLAQIAPILLGHLESVLA